MKILVDELPKNPEECVFYKKETSRDDYSNNFHIYYCCSIDGWGCKCDTCNKLKVISEK